MQQKSEAYYFLRAIIISAVTVSLLWVVFVLDDYYNHQLMQYGMKPKSLEGLIGILTMPFLHSPNGYSHILNNSMAVMVLSTTLHTIYKEIAWKVTGLIWLLTGLLTFFIAKSGTLHIGISGITYGWAAFIFVSGVLRWDRKLTGVSLALVVLYGGLVWGLFPFQEGISWEGHTAGAISGILMAVYFRKAPPQPKKMVYEKLEELGIEPEEPYWDPEYMEQKRLREQAEQLEREREAHQTTKIIYHFKEKDQDD